MANYYANVLEFHGSLDDIQALYQKIKFQHNDENLVPKSSDENTPFKSAHKSLALKSLSYETVQNIRQDLNRPEPFPLKEIEVLQWMNKKNISLNTLPEKTEEDTNYPLIISCARLLHAMLNRVETLSKTNIENGIYFFENFEKEMFFFEQISQEENFRARAHLKEYEDKTARLVINFGWFRRFFSNTANFLGYCGKDDLKNIHVIQSLHSEGYEGQFETKVAGSVYQQVTPDIGDQKDFVTDMGDSYTPNKFLFEAFAKNGIPISIIEKFLDQTHQEAEAEYPLLLAKNLEFWEEDEQQRKILNEKTSYDESCDIPF
jgi:hypothetical protein